MQSKGKNLNTYKIGGNTIYGGTIVDNLDTINKSGFYTCYSTATGVPSSDYSWFILHENSNAGTVSAKQTATAYLKAAIIEYVRVKTISSWGPWKNQAALKLDKTTSGDLRRVYGVNASNEQELTEIETTPTASSTKLVTSGGVRASIPVLVAGENITLDVEGNEVTINSSGGGGGSSETEEIVVATSGSVSQTILANKYYRFTSDAITDLNITTTTKIADIVNEFMFEFIGSSIPTALKVINADSTASADIGTSTGITGASVTKTTFENTSAVNGISGEYTFIYDSELTGVKTVGATLGTLTLTKSTFETQISTAGTYVFTYSSADTSWMFNSSAVTLSTYGIAVTGTPADGDTLTLTYSFRWEYSGTEITLSTYGISVTGTPTYNDEVIVTYNNIKWAAGTPVISVGLTYQASFVNGIGVIIGV